MHLSVPCLLSSWSKCWLPQQIGVARLDGIRSCVHRYHSLLPQHTQICSFLDQMVSPWLAVNALRLAMFESSTHRSRPPPSCISQSEYGPLDHTLYPQKRALRSQLHFWLPYTTTQCTQTSAFSPPNCAFST